MNWVSFNNLGWNTHDDRIWFSERLVYHRICSDITAICNSNLTKDDCTWANINIISNDWSLQTSLVGTNVHIVHYAAILAYLASSIHHNAAIMV